MRYSILISTLLISFAVAAETVTENIVSVYATYQQKETHNNITINYLGRRNSEAAPKVWVSRTRNINPDDLSTRAFEGRKIPLPKISDVFVYSVEVQGLEPATKYYFVTGDPENGYSPEMSFNTLANDDRPITLMQGGDMGADSIIKRIPETALKNDVDVILIGGDIAYADGKDDKFYRWLKWFEHMNEVMVDEALNVTPLIVAIGNHETLSFKPGDPGERVPYYFRLFPQNGFKSYFSRKLGTNNLLLVLDTGHVYLPGGKQKTWMLNELETESETPNKLALYHIPMYPAHRKFELPPSNIMRISWRRVFADHNLAVAFENHDHVYKRTKMLRNDKVVDSNGTVFVGDGCWGRKTRSTDDRWYLHASSGGQHVWTAILESGRISLQASADKNLIYDEFFIDMNEKKVVETLWYLRGLPRPVQDILNY